MYAIPDDSAPSYLLRDRDSIYNHAFQQRVMGMGIREVLTAPHSPWQNPLAERLIGSVRRECLDHIVVLGERHLRRIRLRSGASGACCRASSVAPVDLQHFVDLAHQATALERTCLGRVSLIPLPRVSLGVALAVTAGILLRVAFTPAGDLVLLAAAGERWWLASPDPANPVACVTCHHDPAETRRWGELTARR